MIHQHVRYRDGKPYVRSFRRWYYFPPCKLATYPPSRDTLDSDGYRCNTVFPSTGLDPCTLMPNQQLLSGFVRYCNTPISRRNSSGCLRRDGSSPSCLAGRRAKLALTLIHRTWLARCIYASVKKIAWTGRSRTCDVPPSSWIGGGREFPGVIIVEKALCCCRVGGAG
jgi:hypothetical protein